MTITWQGRKGPVSLFCHYLFGQREQRWLLLYDLAQCDPHSAVRRHRARLQERQVRPPRGRAVPGLRPGVLQALALLLFVGALLGPTAALASPYDGPNTPMDRNELALLPAGPRCPFRQVDGLCACGSAVNLRHPRCTKCTGVGCNAAPFCCDVVYLPTSPIEDRPPMVRATEDGRPTADFCEDVRPLREEPLGPRVGWWLWAPGRNAAGDCPVGYLAQGERCVYDYAKLTPLGPGSAGCEIAPPSWEEMPGPEESPLPTGPVGASIGGSPPERPFTRSPLFLVFTALPVPSLMFISKGTASLSLHDVHPPRDRVGSACVMAIILRLDANPLHDVYRSVGSAEHHLPGSVTPRRSWRTRCARCEHGLSRIRHFSSALIERTSEVIRFTSGER